MIIQNISRQEKFLVEARIPIYQSTFENTFFNLEASNIKHLGKDENNSGDILIEVLEPLPILEIRSGNNIRKYRIINYTKRQFHVDPPEDYNLKFIDSNKVLAKGLKPLKNEFKWIFINILEKGLDFIINNKEFNSIRLSYSKEDIGDSFCYFQDIKCQFLFEPIINFLDKYCPIKWVFGANKELFLSKQINSLVINIIMLSSL